MLRISLAANAGADDLRRDDPVHDPRHDQARDQAGHEGRDEPAGPRDGDANQLAGERGSEDVARLSGEEHRARDRRALIETRDQERTDSARRGAGRGVEQLGDAPGHGQQHAGGAGGNRRHAGGERDVGHQQGVRDAERRLAERADEEQRDAAGESGVEHRPRNEHREDDQPHRWLGEAAQGLAHRRAVGREGRQADDDQGRCRQRLDHHAGDDAGEDGRGPPALRRDGLRAEERTASPCEARLYAGARVAAQ
jgi:hypothetical protein